MCAQRIAEAKIKYKNKWAQAGGGATGKDWSMLKEDTTMEGVAGSALYLLSDLGKSCTGEILHVDAGFHAVAVPDIEE